MIDPATGIEYNIFDLGFDKFLNKSANNADELGLPSIMKSNANGVVNPSNIASGGISQNIRMVDGYIQSLDYVQGVSGWRISADGNVEFAVGTFRGNIQGGQDAYNDGVGFFLGLSSGVYKFSIGDPAGNCLTWDGVNLRISGGSIIDGTIEAKKFSFGSIFYFNGIQTLDCFTQAIAGSGGSITLNGFGAVTLVSGTTIGNITRLSMIPDFQAAYMGNNPILEARLNDGSDYNDESRMVMGSGDPFADASQTMIGFRCDTVNSKVYAFYVYLSGGTYHKVEQLVQSDIFVSELYRIEIDDTAKTINFLINGVSKWKPNYGSQQILTGTSFLFSFGVKRVSSGGEGNLHAWNVFYTKDKTTED